MTSCIATIIKDEQDYLDEWIQYHLNLGIDHIFIFEDIDSSSHEAIISRYEQVTLDKISSVLSVDEVTEIKEMKLNKNIKVHSYYLRKLLSYISDHYSDDYDWCFTTDVDEFLTMEGNIADILYLYQNYDAIVLRWKCYGASGRVSKPDYNKIGMVDAFPCEIAGTVNEKSRCLCKVCYNLKKYRSEFFGNTHNPSDSCKYCNTNFIKDCSIPSYKNMYIRHYITRSWEEYVWKVRVRGYMWGLKRTYDAFFDMNPDMLDLKKVLMSKL